MLINLTFKHFIFVHVGCLVNSTHVLLDMMERAIINAFVGHDVVEPGNYVQMFPYPCYTRDE